MAKDSKGHGSERRGVAHFHGSYGTERVHVEPSHASLARNRGWKEAVHARIPGEVSKVYQSMGHAKAAFERHPKFKGWESK